MVPAYNLMLLKATLSRTGAPIELEAWDANDENDD